MMVTKEKKKKRKCLKFKVDKKNVLINNNSINSAKKNLVENIFEYDWFSKIHATNLPNEKLFGI